MASRVLGPVPLTASVMVLPGVSGTLERTSMMACGSCRRKMSLSISSRTSAWITWPACDGAAGAPNALGSVRPTGRWIASTRHSLRLWTSGLVYGRRVKRSLTLRKPYLSCQGEDGPRRLHVGEAGGAARQRNLVAAPQLHVPVLVDMRGGPRVIDAKLTRRERKRDQRRAGERGDEVDRAEPPRLQRNCGANRGNRSLRLRHEHHAFAEYEARAMRLARPGKHGIPVLRLRGDQSLRLGGAVTHEIGAEVFGDLVRNRLGVRHDTINDRVGELRQRHGRGIDALALRIPFGGDRLRECVAWRHERAARRRLHDAIVEQHRIRRARAGRRILIKSLAQVRAHVAPRRFHRVDRILAEHVLEQFAHEKGLSADWQIGRRPTPNKKISAARVPRNALRRYPRVSRRQGRGSHHNRRGKTQPRWGRTRRA